MRKIFLLLGVWSVFTLSHEPAVASSKFAKKTLETKGKVIITEEQKKDVKELQTLIDKMPNQEDKQEVLKLIKEISESKSSEEVTKKIKDLKNTETNLLKETYNKKLITLEKELEKLNKTIVQNNIKGFSEQLKEEKNKIDTIVLTTL